MTRSERDVAAQVIARLIDQRVIAQSPEAIARAAAATEVPVPEIRNAWHFLSTHRYTPPAPGLPAVPPSPSSTGMKKRPPVELTQRYIKANPEPGKRRCSRCEETKPVDDFPIKDRAAGTRRSYCTPCWAIRQRERYVSVDRERLLNSVGITLTLSDADDVAGVRCADCGAPLGAGDEVHATGVLLRHSSCQAKEQAS